MARELAMKALAEKTARQEKIKDATQRAFLAQAEFDDVRTRFATALRELNDLGEEQSWIRESFGLSTKELRELLNFTPAFAPAQDAEEPTQGNETPDDNDQPAAENEQPDNESHDDNNDGHHQ